jgi:hypothetical protein
MLSISLMPLMRLTLRSGWVHPAPRTPHRRDIQNPGGRAAGGLFMKRHERHEQHERHARIFHSFANRPRESSCVPRLLNKEIRARCDACLLSLGEIRVIRVVAIIRSRHLLF